MNIPASKNIYLQIAMLAAAVMLIGTSWIGDDAFITLRFIDNFVNGFGLRFNIAERVQGYTHPLWLLLLTPFYALTREAMVTTMSFSIMLSLGALWVLVARIAKNTGYGCMMVLLALASRTISSFSSSGLENPLTFLLLALLVWQLYKNVADNGHADISGLTGRDWIPAGIAGLLLLNRLDLAVLVGPVLAYLLFRSGGSARIKVAVMAILPAAAWMVFSLIYYGAPLPNTAYAKLGTGFSTATLIMRGLEYCKDFVLTDPLLALIIIKAVIDSLRSRNWTTLSLGIGIVLYVAYTIVIGGDFMSGRFFSAPGFLALCLLARATVPQWLTKKTKAIVLSGVGILTVLLAMRMMEQPNMDIPSNGITDERRFYYSENGLVPVLKTWVTTGTEPVHPWGQSGLDLKAESLRLGTPIISLGLSTGMQGYYAGPYVHIVDRLALTDAFLARLPAIPGARVGHYGRLIPPGYAETALNTTPTTRVSALLPLLYDETLATRAPLFSQGRWPAIWRLLSGQYAWIYGVKIHGAEQ